MSREIWIGVVITAAIIGGFVYWQYGALWRAADGGSAPPAVDPVAAPVPQAHYPAPEPAAAPAQLPALADSDAPLREALGRLFGSELLERLVATRIIPSLVATVDSLDREPVPLRLRTLAPVPGPLATQAAGGQVVLSPANAARYAPLVRALAAADASAIAQLYLHHYPLFQQAYEELGYPDGYFNNRLVAIIDHLLEAPELRGPVALVRPKVLYQFADPELERLSSGQKTLIRMGPEHAAVVKAKLREIRAIVAAGRRDPA